MVQALLARSPDLDVQNQAGDTALIAASRGGYTAICRLLLSAGADKACATRPACRRATSPRAAGFASITQELAGSG